MSLKRLASSQLTPYEIEEIILPEEVWILIWSFLDFETVQKICTRVSNSWLEMIRRSKMSWEMKLQHPYHDKLEVKDFNSMLLHWKDLRELHFSSETDFTKFCLSLHSHKQLKKVVVPSAIAIYTQESNLEGDSQNLRLINSHFLTFCSHFFAKYMNIFHRT